MFKLTIKNLLANKIRFALTTFGVVLAVSFVASAFILGDGLRSSFNSLTDEITANVDLVVRDPEEVDRLDQADIDAIAEVDGVVEAVGSIEAPENSVRPLTSDDEFISIQGPPQLAFNWVDSPMNALKLAEGSPPGADEFMMDIDAADTHGFEIGETYEVVSLTGTYELTLSGTQKFGEDNDTLGAVLMSFNQDQSEEIFGVTGFDNISIDVRDGTDPLSLAPEIEATTPGFEVVDQETVSNEASEDFTEAIDIIQNILLGFAGIALFVSIFIIYNTFAIVLSQRTREMGLLRALGANTKQLRRSALGEAFFIGLVASIVGIAGGIGVAKGIEALFGAIGADLPAYPIIVSTRTIIAALVVGLGVTMIAAWGPTRRASRVSPIAAIRDGADDGRSTSKVRLAIGALLSGIGVVLGGLGLNGAGSTTATVTLMAVGAIAVFLGVTLIAPLLVKPVAKLIEWPLSKLGVSGRIATQNAERNPRRTSTTAAALMIGLAIVSMALVVGESLKAQFRETLQESVAADYFISEEATDIGFGPRLTEQLEDSGLFENISQFAGIDVNVDETQSVEELASADFDALPQLFNLNIQDGDYVAEPNTLVVQKSYADDNGIAVGDSLSITLGGSQTVQMDVTAIFDEEFIFEGALLTDNATFEAADLGIVGDFVAFDAADGADPAAIDALLSDLEREFPNGTFDTSDGFVQSVEDTINQILAVLNALVALAVLIALLGIANTLALSVFERTRELGLLRAVGMSRRQVRRMVRYEAAIIAFFGAVLGIAVGVLFGWATVTALPASVVSIVRIPVSGIITLLIVSALAGLAAAMLPARKAARMNVLEAIAS